MPPLSGFGLMAIAFGIVEILIRKSLGRSAYQQWTAMGRPGLAKTPEWWANFTWIPVVGLWVLGTVLLLIGFLT